MTPAIAAARKAGIAFDIHQYSHDPSTASFGMEAANALGLDASEVFKTLVIELDSAALAVALVPVNTSLDLKAAASALDAKRAAMADVSAAERSTGYVVGGISPLGQKRRLATVLDESALAHTRVYVSGGRRGLELELAPEDLVALSGARVARIARKE